MSHCKPLILVVFSVMEALQQITSGYEWTTTHYFLFKPFYLHLFFWTTQLPRTSTLNEFTAIHCNNVMKPLSVIINPALSIVHPLPPTNTLYNIINTHYYQLLSIFNTISQLS